MSMVSILRALLPDEHETAFLQACLLHDDAAREPWQRWLSAGLARTRNLQGLLTQRRTLLPLLAHSVSRNLLDLPPDALAFVRAAALREERRSDRFLALAGLALEMLAKADVPALVLRGAALAATVYERPAHRHCHDLDLLVELRALASARAALEPEFRPVAEPARAVETVVAHASGMRVALHTKPFTVDYYNGGGLHPEPGGPPVTIGGVSARVAAPEAALVHVLGHATCNSSALKLHWVADAWNLAARSNDLDWNDVSARLAAHRVQLPASILLTYLESIGARVPSEVTRELVASAARANRVAREVALGGALTATGGDVARLWRNATSSSDRGHLVRWALAPAPGYVRATFPNVSMWRMPLFYVYRHTRFFAQRLARGPYVRRSNASPSVTPGG